MAGRTRKTKDESVWDNDPPVTAESVTAFAAVVGRELERLSTANNELSDLLAAADGSQASAVTAERVVELERQLAEQTKQATIAKDQVDAAWTRQSELERQLAEVSDRNAALWQVTAHRNAALNRAEELEHLLANAYVAREVPWTDVTAGMMTIAKDGTPWMVDGWTMDDTTAVLRNGEKTFDKRPEPGETVRVLVPYVTPEQAESLVKDEPGGTEVE
jgi:hypothetical protein